MNLRGEGGCFLLLETPPPVGTHKMKCLLLLLFSSWLVCIVNPPKVIELLGHWRLKG